MSIGPAEPEPDDLDSCFASSSVVAMVTPSSGLQVIGVQEGIAEEIMEQSREEQRRGQERGGEGRMRSTSTGSGKRN